MKPNVTSIDYYPGSPAISRLPRKPGFAIRGTGFGSASGAVTIDGHTYRVTYWSPEYIVITRGGRNPLWNPYRPPVVTVTRATGRRTAANDASYVLAA